MNKPEWKVAHAVRVVALRLEQAIESGRRSNRIDAEDLRETLLAIADELDPPTATPRRPVAPVGHDVAHEAPSRGLVPRWSGSSARTPAKPRGAVPPILAEREATKPSDRAVRRFAFHRLEAFGGHDVTVVSWRGGGRRAERIRTKGRNMKKLRSLIPAVGYVRMSTDKQEDSPAQQKAEITKLAEREGYRILRWYEDHGFSGAKTLKRPQFRRMIRDAEECGDFKAILCWDQDRFGRFDSIEAGEWISPLRRVGVELVTVCQGRIDWDDFAGRLIYQITQEGKHRYLVDLSRNALRGMIGFAKQGNLLGMATPYGYDRIDYNAAGEEMCRVPRGERFRKPRDWTAKLVPSSDRRAIETVRWIFRTFATTACSARSLAVELNRRKVPFPSGKEWDYTYIKSLLRHPVYIGWLTYGRRGVGLYHHVGPDGELMPARGANNDCPEYAPIIVRDNHEPLIDKATFDAVQAKLKERSIVRGGPNRKHMLSGILRCGHCGGLLIGSIGSHGRTKRNPRYVYYKCRRASASGTCKSYAVRADLIEPEMIACFRSV